MPDKQEKHKEVNGLDAPKKSKMGDPLVFEKIVSWDLRVSDVRAGTFLSDYNWELMAEVEKGKFIEVKELRGQGLKGSSMS